MTVTVYVGRKENGTFAAGFGMPLSKTTFTTRGTEFDVRDFLDRYAGLFRHYGGSVLSGNYREFDGTDGVQNLNPSELETLRPREVK